MMEHLDKISLILKMSFSADVDRLISILGDALSRSRAQRLLLDSGGSVQTAVTAYFSDPRSIIASDDPCARLSVLLGDAISQQRLSRLLELSGGNVERAVDIHFSGLGGSSGEGPMRSRSFNP